MWTADNGAKTVTIDSLRIELSKLAKQKNAQIEALKARIAGLDKKLLLEIEVEEELDKRLAAEQQKEAELKVRLMLILATFMLSRQVSGS